jgi:hypothetical protein
MASSSLSDNSRSSVIVVVTSGLLGGSESDAKGCARSVRDKHLPV